MAGTNQNVNEKEQRIWWASKWFSVLLGVLSGAGLVAAGAQDFLDGWPHSRAMTLIGLIVAGACVILQSIISTAKEKTIQGLQGKIESATADGMGMAYSELSRDLQAITRIHKRGWTPERSEEFQTRVVEMACRALDDSGVKLPRVCFYIAAVTEVIPTEDQDQANIQVLSAFHFSHVTGRRGPSQEHYRHSDEHDMFKLLKDPRPSHIKSRSNLTAEHDGWRSSLRVGVVGNVRLGSNKKAPWGVLTADSTEEYAFSEASEAILGTVADLIILAKTAESSVLDITDLGSSTNGVYASPTVLDLVEFDEMKGE